MRPVSVIRSNATDLLIASDAELTLLPRAQACKVVRKTRATCFSMTQHVRIRLFASHPQNANSGHKSQMWTREAWPDEPTVANSDHERALLEASSTFRDTRLLPDAS